MEAKLKYIDKTLKQIDGNQIVASWPTAGRTGYSVSLKEISLGLLKDIIGDKPKTVILPELGYTQVHKIDGNFYLPDSKIVIDSTNSKQNEKFEKAKKKMDNFCELLQKNGWQKEEIDNKIYYLKDNADITHMYDYGTNSFSDDDKAFYGYDDTTSVDLCIALFDYTENKCLLQNVFKYGEYGNMCIKVKNKETDIPEWKTAYNINGYTYARKYVARREYAKNIK